MCKAIREVLREIYMEEQNLSKDFLNWAFLNGHKKDMF